MTDATAKAFVFDAYGTLFDVHAAMARHRAAAGPDAERFSELWRLKQLEYSWTLTLAGQYVDFWTLTQRALDYAFARMPSVDRALRAPLLDAYQKLDAYPDARATLAALKARGLATAILSNGSPPMLDAAVKLPAWRRSSTPCSRSMPCACTSRVAKSMRSSPRASHCVRRRSCSCRPTAGT